MPKPARPAKTTIIATAKDFTLGGISGEPLACGSMPMPAIAATAMRIANKLASIPTTPAAMMELEGPEGFMVQLYIISAGASNTGSEKVMAGSDADYSGCGGSANWLFTPGRRKKKIHQRLTGNRATTNETASNCLNDSKSDTKCSGMKKVSKGRKAIM